jgi:SNF2 family DNA or RNA helicase
MPLYKYQERLIGDILHGLKYGTIMWTRLSEPMGTSRGVLLAADMGTGKTVMAIVAANRMAYRRILVICSGQLRAHWEEHIREWQTLGHHMYHITSASKHSRDFLAKLSRGWVIINYDALPKFPALKATPWDLVICDESIALKTHNSLRTISVFGGTYAGETIKPIPARKWLMVSGAPNPNRIEEIFPVIHNLDPDHWRSIEDFVDKFYEGFFDSKGDYHDPVIDANWRVSNGTVSDPLMLDRELKRTVMVRVTKADALPDLPPKRHERRVIKLLPGGELGRFLSRKLHRRTEILRDLHSAASDAERRDLQENLNGLHADMAAVIGTSSAKIDGVMAYLLEQKEKVVVFARHLDAIHEYVGRLRRVGLGVVKLTGEDTKNTRSIVKQFTKPHIQFFVSNMEVGGHGLNLQHAAHIVFAELDFDSDVMSQCEDRCHRAGQKREVLITHFILDQSLDGYMLDSLHRKERHKVDPPKLVPPAKFVRDDGGRAAAGFKGHTGDCVVRAISIAMDPSGALYKQVYEALKARMPAGKSVRDGCPVEVSGPYLQELGWQHIDVPITLLKDAKLPAGRLVVETPTHWVAAIDGVFYDSGDFATKSSRYTVCGYWKKE